MTLSNAATAESLDHIDGPDHVHPATLAAVVPEAMNETMRAWCAALTPTPAQKRAIGPR